MDTRLLRMTEFTSARDALRTYFGYDAFRPGQEGIVNAIIQGRDALGVMPTGAGKSICYQIPATLLPGMTIVISPLISLMRDQVDALNYVGISAAFINTTQSPDEQDLVFAQALSGRIRLLYVAPERLETERFRTFASRVPISLVAVDEAHCVSQWGQDFRSSYLGIGDFLKALPTRPTVAAFTATATERVRRDIIGILGLRDPSVTVTGFDRANLYFDVIRMERKHKASWVASYIADHPDESGIVYCATRKEVESLAESLNIAVRELRAAKGEDATRIGTVAVAYHGGMSAETRGRAQRDFVTDRVPVVVATNAFGMGIDKSNVRYVIHHNMPESIEAYYQEAGRAGRDGEPSRCTLLWNESDIATRRRLLASDYENERLTAEEQEVVRASKRRLLNAMIGYCRTTDCLHEYMTRYFGEAGGAAVRDDGMCVGGCANCGNTFETVDVTDIARAISRCVHDVNQKVGSGKIVKVLRGSKAQDLNYLHPADLPTYGMLSETSEARIRDVLSQMATDGFLSISEGSMPIVRFGERAAETVAPNFHYEIKKIERKHATKRAESPSVGSQAMGSYVTGDEDEELFAKLRALRLDIARELGKPPYIVFSDKTLRDMVRIRPVTGEQFSQVNGVGALKLEAYGERFMEVIRDFAA